MMVDLLWRRWAWLPAAIVLLASGCNDVPRFPVKGDVLVNGKPLRGMTGSVTFIPNRAKGNDYRFFVQGDVDADGHYTLARKGSEGAPAGQYKVVITATPPGADREDAKLAVNPRYTVEKTTPLEIEVVPSPSPGAYDLRLTTK